MARLRLIVATLAAVLVTGACSDDAPSPVIADPTPPVTTPGAPVETLTTSGSVTVTPLLSPEDTVRAWVKAWNEALRGGGSTALHQTETPDCRNCANLASVIDDVVAAGGSFAGGEWSIVATKVVPINHHRVKVNVALKVKAGSTVNGAGATPVRFPADKRIAVYELRQSSGIWLIDVIELLS